MTKHTLEEMQLLAKKNGGECLSKKYNKKLQFQCADGHRWKTFPGNIIKGTWCPKCSWYLNEEKCRYIFQELFLKQFPKNRLVLDGLELDGYCEDLHLAFEYQGKQHYEFMVFFHQDDKNNFFKGQANDKKKIKLCRHKKIVLIVIPYWESYSDDNLVRFIKKQLVNTKFIYEKYVSLDEFYMNFSRLKILRKIAENRGGCLVSNYYHNTSIPLEWQCNCGHRWFTSPSCVKSGQWCNKCAVKRASKKQRVSFDFVKSVAVERGGICLSTHYKNNRTKMDWQCSKGHIWKSTYDSVHRGSWCPFCRHRAKLTIEEMKKIARKNGGKCLSTLYINNSTKLEWQCNCGYEWRATPQHIKDGTWCPKCAGQLQSTIQDMMDIAQEKHGLCLSTKYTNAHTKLKWKCRDDHTWWASPTNIKQGRWCRKCYENSLRKNS